MTDEELGEIILKALKDDRGRDLEFPNEHNLVQGPIDRAMLDGAFDLVFVARKVRAALEGV